MASKQHEKDTYYSTELQQLIEQRNTLDRELIILRESYEDSSVRCREAESALEKARGEFRMVRNENDVLRDENNQRNHTLAEQDARKDRDVAVRQLDNVKRHHDELLTKYHAMERELQGRVDYIAQLKNNMQDTHTSIQRNLHSDFDRQRQLWTNEVQELRKENERKTSEMIELSKAADRDKVDRAALHARLVAAEESAQQLQAENDSLQGQLTRNNDDRTKALAEDERLLHNLVSTEGRLRLLESERAKEAHEKQQLKHLLEEEKRINLEAKSLLQSQLSDAELQRRQLAAELRQLKDRIHEDNTTYRVKERLEKDKELLLRENDRLQAEYRESRSENADLMRLVGELRDKASSTSRIQAYM